jgi:hypothetical protein
VWFGSASAGTDTSVDKDMRPLTILLGIVMGSTVSLAVGLLGTWIVILFLPQDAERFAPEHAALLQAITIFTALAAASAFSFYGDLRTRAWRRGAHAVSLLLLVTTIWVYWPS